MAALADSTAGFYEEVTHAQTPAIFGHGARYAVEGPTHLRVTAGGGGDRAVTVAAGTAWGDAVLAYWTSGPTVLNGAAVGSGSRWDTLVVRRDWTEETATLALVQGGTGRSIAPGVQMRNPTPSTGAGFTHADQPIALVRFTQGQTAVQEIIDLRCWNGDGGLVAAHTDALQYLNTVGTVVRVGDLVYARVIDGAGLAVWLVDDMGNARAFLHQSSGRYARMAPTEEYGTGPQFSIDRDIPAWYAQKPSGSGVQTVWRFDENGNLTHGTIPPARLGNPGSTGTFGSAYSGWSSATSGGRSNLRSFGPLCQFILTLRRSSGGTLSFSSTGHTPNTNVFNLASQWRPLEGLVGAYRYRGGTGVANYGGACMLYTSGDIAILDGSPNTSINVRPSGDWSAQFTFPTYLRRG